MLIAHALYLVAFVALLAAALRGLWQLLARGWDRRRARRWARFEPTAPPRAHVRGRAVITRDGIARWLPFALLFGGGSAALELHLHATDVWVVTDAADGGLAVARADYLGDAAAAYAPLAGDLPIDDDAWVVNRSARLVRVEYSVYGGYDKLPDRYATAVGIAPGAAASVEFVDDIGPDHPPPSSIDSRAHSLRGWLTWLPHGTH